MFNIRKYYQQIRNFCGLIWSFLGTFLLKLFYFLKNSIETIYLLNYSRWLNLYFHVQINFVVNFFLFISFVFAVFIHNFYLGFFCLFLLILLFFCYKSHKFFFFRLYIFSNNYITENVNVLISKNRYNILVKFIFVSFFIFPYLVEFITSGLEFKHIKIILFFFFFLNSLYFFCFTIIFIVFFVRLFSFFLFFFTSFSKNYFFNLLYFYFFFPIFLAQFLFFIYLFALPFLYFNKVSIFFGFIPFFKWISLPLCSLFYYFFFNIEPHVLQDSFELGLVFLELNDSFYYIRRLFFFFQEKTLDVEHYYILKSK